MTMIMQSRSFELLTTEGAHIWDYWRFWFFLFLCNYGVTEGYMQDGSGIQGLVIDDRISIPSTADERNISDSDREGSL